MPAKQEACKFHITYPNEMNKQKYNLQEFFLILNFKVSVFFLLPLHVWGLLWYNFD